jgi:hypothetical protein
MGLIAEGRILLCGGFVLDKTDRHSLSVQNTTDTCSFHETGQVNPGESCDPLLMSLVKSTSICVDEGGDGIKDF